MHNNQGVSTEGHRTPEQLWNSRILSQRSSSWIAIVNMGADREYVIQYCSHSKDSVVDNVKENNPADLD